MTERHLEDIMLSEINQTERQTLHDLTCEILNKTNKTFIVTENRMLTRSKGEIWIKGYQPSVIRGENSRDPKYARRQTRLSDFTFTFHLHALEKEMATHSSVLAWRIPGTGEPGGLPSMGSHRVGQD